MKKVLLILSFLTMGLSSAYAHESDQVCQLSGELSGIGISIGLGGQFLSGEGYITCSDAYGDQFRSYPVGLEFVSGGIGLDFTWVRSLTFRSAPVRVAIGAVDLLGSYSVGATAGVTLITAGIDFDAALMLQGDHGLAIEAGLSGRDAIGLGVRLHAATLHVRHL